MSKTLVWGGGSCLKLLMPYLWALGRRPDFVFSDNLNEITSATSFTRSNRPDIYDAASQCDAYVISIGDSHGKRRNELSNFFRYEYGLKPLTLIHPTAFICSTAQIQDPVFIMPRVVINSYASIGCDSIINTNAIVEHETLIGQGVHIMGSAVITGRCTIESFATIGTNATVLPDLTVGEDAFVGAGAVVTQNVEAGNVVVGIPAKPRS
tara:strand:+ start:163 stop:789 length:627 start_codon:yes stop_codon:yes gene_type:complete